MASVRRTATTLRANRPIMIRLDMTFRTKGPKRSRDLRPRKFLLDHARERLQRLGPVERPPVDEEGRRAVDAEPRALLEVALHRGPVDAAGDAALERRHLEPDLLGVAPQVVGGKVR